MNKFFGVLLLASLAMANVQQEPVDGIVECLATYVPKLVQDAEKVYADVQNQDFSTLFADVQLLAADAQAAVACFKSQAVKAIQVKENQELVEDTLQCITQYAPKLVAESVKLVADYGELNIPAIIADALAIYSDATGLVNCLQNKEAVRIFVAKLLKAMEKQNVFDCVFKYIPALVADAKNFIADYQNGDYSALIAHVQALVADGQAFAACIQA